MSFQDVVNRIADELYDFVGYRVENRKGKANMILVKNEEDLKREAQLEFLKSLNQDQIKPYEEIIDLMAEEIADFANGKRVNFEDIKTYFKPLIESSVAIDKYINQSANEIMDDFPEDGTIQDKVDFFIGLKERKKLVESKMSAINNVIQQIQPELIGWLDASPTNNMVGSNGKKVSTRISVYPKVRDLASLKAALADVWEKFEGVNTKELGNLIRGLRDRSKTEGIDVHELLPPGLDISITKSLTVSAGTSNSRYKDRDSLDDLIDLIKGNKGETE